MCSLAGRGVSQIDVEQQRLVYQEARDAYRIAGEELSALELQFVSEAAADRERLAAQQLELEQLRIDLEMQTLAMEQSKATLDAEYLIARERAEAARQVQSDETRDGSFIVVLAPLSGVVTSITYSQAGDKVQANTPLLAIALEDIDFEDFSAALRSDCRKRIFVDGCVRFPDDELSHNTDSSF